MDYKATVEDPKALTKPYTITSNPGIDLIFYGNERQLEYDWVVAPGAEDEAVFAGRDGPLERMKFIGANREPRFDPLDKQPGISNYFIGNDPSKWRTNIPNYGRGSLGVSMVQHKPVILQEGKRIEGGYVVRGHEVAFELAKYDAAKPLVIDPVLVYSTPLGSAVGQG